MSAAPGDRPRGDSFEDEGSPSETKDGAVKHVVSLRRQTDAPAPPADGSPRRPRSDDAPEVEGSPDDVDKSPNAPPTPAATRRWRKAKHAVSFLNPAKLLKKREDPGPTPTGGQLLTMTAQQAAPTRSSWHKPAPKIKRTSSSDSTSSTLAKEKRQRLRKMKRARSRTTFTDLIGLFEKQDDDIEKELLDDMRSNKFPRHRAHWLVMDPLQRWRLKWDILMMLMICLVPCGNLQVVLQFGVSRGLRNVVSGFGPLRGPRRRDSETPFHTGFVMIVTPFELAFVSAVGWSKNYTPFPNKYTGLFITNWTVNLLFIVDILFNFLTAVYDPQLNKWLLRFDQIALHYARGWMALDVVSMLPVEYMIKSKQASAIRLLRVFRLMKLAKVLRSQELVNNIAKHVDMSTKLQTVIKYCVVLIVIVHWTACALKLVTEYTLAECSWDDCPQTILTSTSNYRDGIWAQYVEAAVWALVAINGEASTRTHGEGVLGLLARRGVPSPSPGSAQHRKTKHPRPRLTEVMLGGIIVMAFLIGDLSNIMSNLDPVANEFKQTLDNLNDYMHRSGFDNDLRLKLREYIMLSEPCFRDHFNKEMLTKLSPTLISVVARKKMGHVVEKIPFYAHTVQRTGGYPKGQRVMVHDREWERGDDEEMSVGRPALVLRSPSLLRYDVQFDDGEVQKNVRHTHIEPPPLPPDLLHLRRGEIQRLHFQRDLFLSKVASLFTTRLFMTFDVIVHKDLSLNDVMYVIEHGKVCCLNYDARKTFGISVKQDDEFIGDDIAMLARSPRFEACGAREKILRHYSCHATAVTQMHALDAMDFCHLLEQEPALSLFYKHFRTWGCWQRLSRALTLNGARLVSMARMVGDGTDSSTLKEKLAALAAATDEAVELTPKDTASLLSLVSDATSSGFAGHRKRAAMAKLAELVRELRLSS